MGGGGGQVKFYPYKKVRWGGGAQTVLDPQFSHFVAPPPLPVINDQSLSAEEDLLDITH